MLKSLDGRADRSRGRRADIGSTRRLNGELPFGTRRAARACRRSPSTIGITGNPAAATAIATTTEDGI